MENESHPNFYMWGRLCVYFLIFPSFSPSFPLIFSLSSQFQTEPTRGGEAYDSLFQNQPIPSEGSRERKHTCNDCAEIRESWPIEIFKWRETLGFFFSSNHAAKAAAIHSATASVRLIGSPSTPPIATPRISLHKSKHALSEAFNNEEQNGNPLPAVLKLQKIKLVEGWQRSSR